MRGENIIEHDSANICEISNSTEFVVPKIKFEKNLFRPFFYSIKRRSIFFDSNTLFLFDDLVLGSLKVNAIF